MVDIFPTPRPIPRPPGRHFTTTIQGYDAVDDRGRRRPPPKQTMHEDEHARQRDRLILSASSRDLARNFAIAAWAIRKHLDYIADFTFQAQTPDSGFNKDFEAWHALQAKAENFDVAGRHSQRRAVRLAEAGKTVDGDHWWLKLAPNQGSPLRGKRQLIEGDRIDMPSGDLPKNSKPEEWINGCRIDLNTGRTIAVGVCKRVGRNRKELQRIVAARNISQLAAFEFRVDQIRGISPIASALNWFRDTYEGFEYALAKMKIAQLFGLQITRHADTSGSAIGPHSLEGDADSDGVPDSAPRIELNRGPFVAELEPGEEIKTIDGGAPAAETTAFLNLMILISIKCLDLPISFWDEGSTNFYGSRGGMIQYLHSCNNKVLDLQDFQNADLRWRAGLAVEDGELVLPSGKDLDFLKFEYVPGGVPWFDSAKESRGQAMSIAMAQTSPQRVCRETGTDFFKNVDDIAEAMKYASEKGVSLTFADAAAFAPEITVQAAQ